MSVCNSYHAQHTLVHHTGSRGGGGPGRPRWAAKEFRAAGFSPDRLLRRRLSTVSMPQGGLRQRAPRQDKAEEQNDTDTDAGMTDDETPASSASSPPKVGAHSKGENKGSKIKKRLFFGSMLLVFLCCIIAMGHLWTLYLVRSRPSPPQHLPCTTVVLPSRRGYWWWWWCSCCSAAYTCSPGLIALTARFNVRYHPLRRCSSSRSPCSASL
jgi:hypothetical protein